MPAFLVDENLPHQLVRRAHENGHETRWVRDIMPGAARFYASFSGPKSILSHETFDSQTRCLPASEWEALSGVVLIREERMQQIRAARRRYVERDEYPRQSIVVL